MKMVLQRYRETGDLGQHCLDVVVGGKPQPEKIVIDLSRLYSCSMTVLAHYIH